MDAVAVDIAVFGSTPLAVLLAGALAVEHGKQVALIAAPYSPLRLPPGINVASGATTRPETWALLKSLETDTARLILAAGAPPSLRRLDLALHADLPATREAVDHIRHLARGFGFGAELSRSGDTLTIRNVSSMDEAALYPFATNWLESLGVIRIAAADAKLSLQKTGAATISTAERTITARQVVLGDDASLLSHVSEAQWPDVLRAVESTATLTSHVRQPPRSIARFLDRDVVVSTRGQGLLVHVSGNVDADARLGASIASHLPLVRVATRRFRAVASVDGAPFIGWLKAPKLFVVAGLDATAAFYAPALARLIAGKPSAEEKIWFAARDPEQIASRADISEFVTGGFV